MVKRSFEFDLLRIILMLTLPLIHVVEYWGYVCGGADILMHSAADSIEPVARFAEFYTAPCFMVMMGINMVFTRHNSPKDFLRRGVLLLCLEFGFNLVRYVMPALIGFAIGEYKPEVMEYAFFGLFNSDILSFAGLAFIVMAALKKLKATPVATMFVAAAMYISGMLLTRFASPWLCAHCGSQLLNLLGSFVWVNGDSTFPLLQWMIYPAFGYLFISRPEHWNIGGITGIVVMALLIVETRLSGLSIYESLCLNGTDHYITPSVALFSFAATFTLMWLCHIISPALERSSRTTGIVTALGSRLTVFYLIQWTIVGWGLFITGGTGLWGCQAATLGQTVIYVLAITIFSFLLSLSLKKGRQKRTIEKALK